MLFMFTVVSDVQVHVLPVKENQTVTLMCRTSCPLSPYSWFKNGKYFYENSSPWYQELVSSDEAVKYSCAIKGYKHLRAPAVSVGE